MILVTGGAGFIGSNVIKKLNQLGHNKIIIMDNLKNGKKIFNITNRDFLDYVDYQDWFENQNLINFSNLSVIFHLGACSATTNWDGKFLMKYNYEFSKILYANAQKFGCQFIYASSASVYGIGQNGFFEERACESAINPYAFSKLAFDNFVRYHESTKNSQVVGLRYFNVYGENEYHKGNMKSPILKFYEQLRDNNTCEVFEGYNGGEMDENTRDFVSVEDCCDVNIWFMQNPKNSGIFNVGSGSSVSFLDIAKAVVKNTSKETNIMDKIKKIPFPSQLKGSYQQHTCADLSRLRSIGYKNKFVNIEIGIKKYFEVLLKNNV